MYIIIYNKMNAEIILLIIGGIIIIVMMFLILRYGPGIQT